MKTPAVAAATLILIAAPLIAKSQSVFEDLGLPDPGDVFEDPGSVITSPGSIIGLPDPGSIIGLPNPGSIIGLPDPGSIVGLPDPGQVIPLPGAPSTFELPDPFSVSPVDPGPFLGLPGTPTAGLPDPGNMIDTIGECINNLGDCPEELIDQAGWAAVGPSVEAYFAGLEAQNTDGSRLPWDLIETAQPYYAADLDSVIYAENIETGHGEAITVGNRVYFPTSIDIFGDQQDLHWMLHELQHVAQYEAAGGIDAFVGAYSVEAAKQMIDHGTFDVHDLIDVEQDADMVADELIRDVFGRTVRVHNECSEPIRLAILYMLPDGDWEARGYWNFSPGEQAQLVLDGDLIRTVNSNVYMWAESTDGSYSWVGDGKYSYTVVEDGTPHDFQEINAGQGNLSLDTSFSC